MFGIKHPIIQGGLHYVGFAELAAARGIWANNWFDPKNRKDLANEISKCRHDR